MEPCIDLAKCAILDAVTTESARYEKLTGVWTHGLEDKIRGVANDCGVMVSNVGISCLKYVVGAIEDISEVSEVSDINIVADKEDLCVYIVITFPFGVSAEDDDKDGLSKIFANASKALVKNNDRGVVFVLGYDKIWI